MALLGFPHFDEDVLKHIKLCFSLESVLIRTIVAKFSKEVVNHIVFIIFFFVRLINSLVLDLGKNLKLLLSSFVNSIVLPVFSFFFFFFLSFICFCFSLNLTIAIEHLGKLSLNHFTEYKAIDQNSYSFERN